MDFMGHSRKGKGTTLAVYAHVTAKTFQQARDAVDGALFPAQPRRVKSAGTGTELAAA